jgi:hypothetical protein
MAEKHVQAPLSQKGGKEPAWWEQRKAEAWKKFQAMPTKPSLKKTVSSKQMPPISTNITR